MYLDLCMRREMCRVQNHLPEIGMIEITAATLLLTLVSWSSSSELQSQPHLRETISSTTRLGRYIAKLLSDWRILDERRLDYCIAMLHAQYRSYMWTVNVPQAMVSVPVIQTKTSASPRFCDFATLRSTDNRGLVCDHEKLDDPRSPSLRFQTTELGDSSVHPFAEPRDYY